MRLHTQEVKQIPDFAPRLKLNLSHHSGIMVQSPVETGWNLYSLAISSLFKQKLPFFLGLGFAMKLWHLLLFWKHVEGFHLGEHNLSHYI